MGDTLKWEHMAERYSLIDSCSMELWVLSELLVIERVGQISVTDISWNG